MIILGGHVMKNIWFNLASDDPIKAASFYSQLGFALNPNFKVSEELVSLSFQNTTLMIFKKGFFIHKLEDDLHTHVNRHEVLLSIQMPTIEEAEILVRKAEELGGQRLYHPTQAGNMYNTGFVDIDGHWWNVLVFV